MLSRPNRLHKDREFSKVFRTSRPIFTGPKGAPVGGSLAVRAMKRADSLSSRFGFVVSNKIDKRATRRNGLKRRMRSAVRELLPVVPSFNVVIMVKQNYPFPYQYSDIKRDIEEAFVKLKIM